MAPDVKLIKKLEKISSLQDKILSIQDKMNCLVPEDNYERKINIPAFPGKNETDYDLKARENLEEVDHTDEDAFELMTEAYNICYAPKMPSKPTIKNFEYSGEAPNNEKLGCFSTISLVVSAFVLIGSFVGVTDSETDVLPTLYTISAIAAVAFIIFMTMIKMKNQKYNKEKARALEEYNCQKDKVMAEHEKKLETYKADLRTHESNLQNFLKEYGAWRKIYLESLNEEAEIKEKLEADRIAAVKKIEVEELDPVLQEMTEINDILTTNYLPAINIIIELLKNGRADNIKEAINVYEEMVYRERQLQLQREQEAQRRREEERRRQDEERRYREEKRFREQQEWERKREAEERARDEERRHKEEMAQREKQERDRRYEEDRLREEQRRREEKAEYERRRQESDATRRQCNTCALCGKCSMSFRRPNCASYRPR